jgi:hypothetical protein
VRDLPTTEKQIDPARSAVNKSHAQQVRANRDGSTAETLGAFRTLRQGPRVA